MYDLLLLNLTRISHDPRLDGSIGLHSIAAYAKTKGFNAKVYSGNIKNCKSIIVSEITGNQVPIVGFYVGEDNIVVVSNVIRWLKSTLDVLVIVGGPQSVALGEEFLYSTKCDCICEGEGEETITELLDFVINGLGNLESIHGLKYCANGVFKVNPQHPPICDLDRLPFPSYENSLNQRFRKGEMVGILTGRGCPFGCAFCYEGANAKVVRFRSIVNVMAEIDMIMENNPNLKTINVYDDTFTLNKERVLSFCKGMKERKVRWFCEAHISTILKDPDMLEEMIASGLISMQIGIESGSNRVLKAYNKSTTCEDILRIVKLCKGMGLANLSGNFIIGGAMETEETFQESVLLVKEMLREGKGMFECRTVFLAPYPKTAISSTPEEFELELDQHAYNNSVVSMNNPVMRTHTLTLERIFQLREEFEELLTEEYAKLALESTRYDVINCFYGTGEYNRNNVRWAFAYGKYPHINEYTNSGFFSNDMVDLASFPVRTFGDMNYLKKVFPSKCFSQTEISFLFLSNGRNTFSDIANSLKLPEEELVMMFKNFEDRCLVYQSEF